MALPASARRMRSYELHEGDAPMLSMFRTLKTNAEAAPLHYAIVGTAIAVALLIALSRVL